MTIRIARLTNSYPSAEAVVDGGILYTGRVY
jgi:hypothetical protein